MEKILENSPLQSMSLCFTRINLSHVEACSDDILRSVTQLQGSTRADSVVFRRILERCPNLQSCTGYMRDEVDIESLPSFYDAFQTLELHKCRVTVEVRIAVSSGESLQDLVDLPATQETGSITPSLGHASRQSSYQSVGPVADVFSWE